MRGHDVSDPVTSHIRIKLRDSEDLKFVESTVAEIVQWNRETGTEKLESVDALVTSGQLAELQTRGLPIQVIAPVWTQADLKTQVSQVNRYKNRLEQLKTSKRRK